jgi:Flp pilus assembly protein TadG
MKKFLRNNKAVTAIEFAILAPVFFLIFMGIIEIGLTMFFDATMNTALRSAARNGVTNGYSNMAEVRDVMDDYMAGIYDVAPKMSVVVLTLDRPATVAGGVNLADAEKELRDLETFSANFRANPDSYFTMGDSFSGSLDAQRGAIVIYAARYQWGGFSKLMQVFLPDNLYAVSIVRNEVFD